MHFYVSGHLKQGGDNRKQKKNKNAPLETLEWICCGEINIKSIAANAITPFMFL